VGDDKIGRLMDQMQAVEIALAGLSADELAELWRRLRERERAGQQGAGPVLRVVPGVEPGATPAPTGVDAE
jgi:hypothetical protein